MPEWTLPQREAIAARNGELLVSAAAGSGKTAVLVEHVLSLLREGGDITRLLIITFTRAAAAELRERLAAAIEREAASNAHMRRQLLRVKRAEICTLHVFCHNVIRRHFESADADPTARVGENTALEPLYRRAVDEAMEALCQSGEEDARALLRQYGDAQIVDMADALYTFLRAQRAPWAWLESHADIDSDEAVNEALLVLRKECLLHLEGALQLCAQMERLLSLPGAPGHLEATAKADRALIEELRDQARAGTLTGGEIAFIQRARAPKGAQFDADIAARFITLRERLKEVARAARGMLPPDLQTARDDIRFTQPALRALCALARDIDARYAAFKEARSLLDYSDLEHKALRALDVPRVRQAVAARYDAIFVDEYQDVSAIEESIVRAVHTPANRLFMVGDVKQSIYRFRLADPTLFLSKYERFGDEKKAVSRRIMLSSNFRSRANILACVNCVFARAMRRAATEIDYDENAVLRPGAPTSGDPPVELHLIVPRAGDAPDGEPPESDAADEASPDASPGENKKGWMYEAELAAQLIRDLLGRPVRDKNGERPLRYRDFVILLRSASGRAPHIAKILSAAGIPAYSDADAQYYDLPEVRDMLNVLRVLDNPLQDTALLGALRCPCFGFSSERLARIRLTDGTRQKPFYEVFFALRASDKDVRAACEKLDRWRFLAESLPVDTLLWLLMEETGLYALAGAGREGAARQANLRLLAERAQEGESKRSLHAFLELAELSRKVDDTRAAKELGESEDVVRIMTLHKSKGLEFPVVILMELARAFRMPSDGELLRMDARVGLALKKCDDETRLTGHTLAGRAIALKRARETRAEEARLLYVGMTRARERLILLASPRALPAALEGWALPEGDYAAGCAKRMLDWIGQALYEGLAPGEDAFFTASGGGDWLLRFHAPSDFCQYLPGESAFVAPDLTGAPNKITCRRMETAPARGLRLKTSVSALLRGGLTPEEEETPETKRRALRLDAPPPALPPFLTEDRLTPAQRGSAAHKALGLLDLRALQSAEKSAIPALVKAQLSDLRARARLSQPEYEAADAGDIARFLLSDLGARLLRSPLVRRESGFVLRWQGVLVQGVPDLCFIEDGAWVLVDYKTDRCPPEELLPRYREQLLWYARALETLTHQPVREIWLYSLLHGREVAVPPASEPLHPRENAVE